MGVEDILESPAFWLLGVGSSIAVLMGWIWSKNQGWVTLPFWQMLIMIAVCLGASAYFGTRE